MKICGIIVIVISCLYLILSPFSERYDRVAQIQKELYEKNTLPADQYEQRQLVYDTWAKIKEAQISITNALYLILSFGGIALICWDKSIKNLKK
jgi:hypothetical protein